MRPSTPREQQIIELVLTGADNKEIACQLGVKVRTIKSHMNRLFLRYGIADGVKRVKLIRRLYEEKRNGL